MSPGDDTLTGSELLAPVERCSQVPEGLLRDARLTDAAVLVAGYVAQFGGEHGCFAAEATIARDLGYSDVRTAGRALAAIDRAGWMRTETTATGRCSRWIVAARPGERANIPRTLLRADASLRPYETRVYAIARYWLETGRQVTAARVAEALPHAELRTSKTHLRTVVDRGLLLRVGQGRGTRYRLADPAVTAGQTAPNDGYPQDTAKGCKSWQADPVDTRERVQIEARNGANRGVRNGANSAPREGAPSIDGAPEGSPVVTLPSTQDVVTAHEPARGEGNPHIERVSERHSELSADADQPEPSTPSAEALSDPEVELTEECYVTARGIVAKLPADIWPLDTKQAARLAARLVRLLCFGGLDAEALTTHLTAAPMPDMVDPFGVLLARLKADRLPDPQTPQPGTTVDRYVPFAPGQGNAIPCKGHPLEEGLRCRVCRSDLVAEHGIRGDEWQAYGDTPYAALLDLAPIPAASRTGSTPPGVPWVDMEHRSLAA